MIVRYYPLNLTLRAPVLLGSLEGGPDSARSLDHIPGSVLRGAVARALGSPGSDPARLATFREIVLGGAVRYLHSFPMRDGRRSFPTPISMRPEKHASPGGPVEVFDLAAFEGRPDEDHDVEDQWPADALGGVPGGQLTIGAAQPGLVRAARAARLHHQRDRVNGRPRTATTRGRRRAIGTIFAYEYLDGAQTFAGVVQIRGESEAEVERRLEIIRGALGGVILLGRSRRSGYGGDAEIAWQPSRPREVEGSQVINRDIQAGEMFRLLCVAPCIGLDDATGQPDPVAARADIVRLLADRVTVQRVRWGFATAGGFNSKWGLELPQVAALEGGSVMVLRATSDIPLADLLAAEHHGLGERRGEGFGRISFLESPTRTLLLAAESTRIRAAERPSGEPPALVRRIEARMLRARVEQRISEEAMRIGDSATHRPTTSLIGRLRVPLRTEPVIALRTLRAWLGDGPNALRAAMDKVERCRLPGHGSLAAWLRSVIDENGLDSALGRDSLAQQAHLVSEESANAWVDTHRDALRVRLIDEVLGVMARLQRQSEQPAPAQEEVT